MSTNFVYGPTFAEMRDPSRIKPEVRKQALEMKRKDPLDPVNLFNITWKDESLHVPHVVLPSALTGVDANIVVMIARYFPTGAHKVGPAYSCLIEKQLAGELQPGRDRLVFPSTGNYGIGGAWVGPRMNYESLVVLPAEMSAERFEKIEGYGAHVIKTPGSESNVKEIYDKVKELRADKKNRILNQFEEFGNYRFHNVMNMDWLICIDDLQCLKGLQLLQEGTDVLIEEGVEGRVARAFVDTFGVSSICNILGAIKTAKAIQAGKGQNVVTVATDGF